MKITLSKSQWEFIGVKTGWIKTAKDMRDLYVSFIDELIFDGSGDINLSIKEGLNPNNIWIVTYDNNLIQDSSLAQHIYDQKAISKDPKFDFYKEFFKVCDIRAELYTNSTIKKNAEELVDMINNTCGMEMFFDFIRQNSNIYNTERQIEERQLEVEGL